MAPLGGRPKRRAVRSAAHSHAIGVSKLFVWFFFCRICLLAVKIESITVGDNGPIDCRRTARTAHTQTHTHSRRLDNKELANSKKLVSPKKGRATHRLQQRIDTDVVIFNPRDYTDQGWALKGLNLTPQPPPQPLYQEKKPRHSERVWGCGCVNEIEEDPSRPTIPLQQWPRQHVKEDPRKDSTNRKKGRSPTQMLATEPVVFVDVSFHFRLDPTWQRTTRSASPVAR